VGLKLSQLRNFTIFPTIQGPSQEF